jgi:hypothetical protein
MQTSEKIKILDDAAERSYRLLEEATFGTEEAAHLLTNIQQIEVLKLNLAPLGVNLAPANPIEVIHPRSANPARTEDESACNVTPFPQVAAEETTATAPIEDGPGPGHAPTSTEIDAETRERLKAELRVELLQIQSKHGVNVSGIIEEMGYAKLSDVPLEQYGLLRDKAYAAAGVR